MLTGHQGRTSVTTSEVTTYGGIGMCRAYVIIIIIVIKSCSAETSQNTSTFYCIFAYL